MNTNFKLIASLMYVRGADGLSVGDVKLVLNMPTPSAREVLREFTKWWNEQELGVQVIEVHDIFKMTSLAEFDSDLARLVTEEKKQRLSQAAIETAGIIAYRQPISRGAINEIRGVASEAVVSTLLIKGLIEEKGFASTPGRPVLYGITDKFYDYFQIKSLGELPKLTEFSEDEGLADGFELFESQREVASENE